MIGALAALIGATTIAMGPAGAKIAAVIRGESEIYVHAGGQYEWDSAAPVAVALASGLHASRIDDSPLHYGLPDPWFPDLLVCHPALADEAPAVFEPENFNYPYGTHACVVEVDLDTGWVRILDYVAVDDCGRAVSPVIVEGQIHGSTAQGIAQALLEEAAYDDEGQPLATSFLTYAVPSAVELPSFRVSRIETPTARNPLGAKGVGEAGSIGAPPAVVNAVLDALAPLGIRHLDMPLTPERVWRAVAAAQATRY